MGSERVNDTSVSQPNVEGNTVDGTGAGSRSAAGGNKRDPLSTSPSMGATIAGRTINTGAPGDGSNPGSSVPEVISEDTSSEERRQPGGTDTGGRGVTGHIGKDEGSGHAVSGDSSSDSGQ